jgi:hypothetical protein
VNTRSSEAEFCARSLCRYAPISRFSSTVRFAKLRGLQEPSKCRAR